MQRDLHFGHLTLNRTRAKPFLCEKFGGPVYKFSGLVSPLSVKTLEHKHNCSYVFAGYIRSLPCWTLAHEFSGLPDSFSIFSRKL